MPVLFFITLLLVFLAYLSECSPPSNYYNVSSAGLACEQALLRSALLGQPRKNSASGGPLAAARAGWYRKNMLDGFA